MRIRAERRIGEALRDDVEASGAAEIRAVAHNHRAQGAGDNEWYTLPG